MSDYFSKFPIVQYQDVFVRDITRKNKFREQYLSDPKVFLPYTVQEGERPEDIAHYYYGSVDATWIVLLANNIIDPYFGWYMSEDLFNKYLIEKYKDVSGRTGYAVIDWTKNQTLADNVAFYYRDVDAINGGTPTTFVADSISNFVDSELPEDFDDTVVEINGVQYLLQRVE